MSSENEKLQKIRGAPLSQRVTNLARVLSRGWVFRTARPKGYRSRGATLGRLLFAGKLGFTRARVTPLFHCGLWFVRAVIVLREVSIRNRMPTS